MLLEASEQQMQMRIEHIRELLETARRTHGRVHQAGGRSALHLPPGPRKGLYLNLFFSDQLCWLTAQTSELLTGCVSVASCASPPTSTPHL